MADGMEIDRIWLNLDSLPDEVAFLIMIDTNVLLSHLTLVDTIRRQLISKAAAAHHPVLLVPQLVLRELDGLKSQQRITHQSGKPEPVSILARKAINWLMDAMSSQDPLANRVLRGQRKDETLHPLRAATTTTTQINDDILLDVALYHQQRGRSVCLVTADHNLIVRARIENIWSINAHTTPPDSTLEQLGLVDSTNPPLTSKAPAANAPRDAPKPVPLSSTNDMHIDDDDIPLSSGPMPDMLPVFEPLDVLLNIALVFHHYIAPLVYRHLRFETELYTTLSDWRSWTADDIVYALRNDSNAFHGLVERGLTTIFGPAPTRTTPPPATARSLSSVASPSRWARPASSSTPIPVPSTKTNGSATPPSTSAAAAAAAQAARTTVSDVERSLPSILQAFACIHNPHVSVFTSARWLVVLESVQLLMSCLLSAENEADVSDDVRYLVDGWRKDLVRLQCIPPPVAA